ncbi:MAG: 2-oxoacid:acceptor oxidoreductase family protein [Candidatus Zixiibacteriota bacterium]
MAQDILKPPASFYKNFDRKPDTNQDNTHYCPGCGHGVMHKLIAEAIEDFGIADRTIMISPVGCSVFVYYYFDTGNVQVAHGRAPAVATGLKRANPDSIVISYQGDGDLAAIGGNHILQAANRGENITVFFINNAIYGMTGGQMAPTTLIGQKTTTSPYGRSVQNEGYPMKMCELLSSLESPTYLERVAIGDAKDIMKARKAVRKAIKCQMDGKGFSMVEALAICPSGWKTTPVKSRELLNTAMKEYFPPGVTKDVIDERESFKPEKKEMSKKEILDELGLGEELPEHKMKMSDVKEEYRNPGVIIAGFGGQGVLVLGNTLATTGMIEGFNVSWIPSYGPEMRGGTANCHVRINENDIGTPVVDEITALIAMNKPSMEKFEKKVKPGGLMLYNTSMIDTGPSRDDITAIPVPATEIAQEIGSLKIANMVMVGAFMEATGVITEEALHDALQIAVKHKKFLPMNKQAIDMGVKAVKDAK